MSFKGKGLVVGLVSVIPQIFEAIAVGLCAMHFWGFPLALALALGFLIAGVSPAVVIPLMISFKNREVGKKKGIPDILLAACTLDVNLSILWFGVFM